MSFCQLLGWRPGTDLIQKYSTHCVGIAFFVTVGLVSQKKPLCFLLHLGTFGLPEFLSLAQGRCFLCAGFLLPGPFARRDARHMQGCLC